MYVKLAVCETNLYVKLAFKTNVKGFVSEDIYS